MGLELDTAEEATSGGRGGAAEAAAEASGRGEGGDGWLVGGEARWLLSCLNPGG